jgi:hypothetical protein
MEGDRSRDRGACRHETTSHCGGQQQYLQVYQASFFLQKWQNGGGGRAGCLRVHMGVAPHTHAPPPLQT